MKFSSLVKLKDDRDTLDSEVAILVRVKNESERLPSFLDSLYRQKTSFKFEKVFLDSGSMDETINILMAVHGSALYKIDPSEFRFGETCNLMMELSNAEICIFFSGHVQLLKTDVLEEMVDSIRSSDASAVAVRQVPNEESGSSIYERVFLARRFPSGKKNYPSEGNATVFSNACSAIHRAAWEECKFPDVVAGEDRLWAEAIVKKGRLITYLPHVEVAHSHNESTEIVQKRVYINKTSIFGRRRMIFKSAYYFLGIFSMLMLNGESLSRSCMYAWAHASAYIIGRGRS